MTQKVYATGPTNSFVVKGPPVVSEGYGPKFSSSLPRLAWQPLNSQIFKSLQRTYKRLPWTTRHTVRAAISLYALLYIFFTVPVRLAFYYDPYRTKEEGHVNHWTPELSVFAAMDTLVDLIGIVEFLHFYRLHGGFFAQFTKFEAGKRVSRRNSLQSMRKLTRMPSFNGLRRGKTKWTLASIGRAVSMQDIGAEDSVSERNVVRMRNIELMLEIAALLPIEVIPYATGVYNMLHLVRITKLCRLYKLPREMKRLVNIYSDRVWVQNLSSTGIETLVRNIGFCIGLSHWVACGYMLLAHAQCGISLEFCDEKIETSWAVRDRLAGASVARKYARTIYWASRTLVLLGYDDVTPVSDAETVYAVAVTLMGALFGSSLLATFLFIFRFRNARHAAFSTHVDNAREYMKSQSIPRALRRQVIAYFTYSWNTHHSLNSEEALHLMPRHLQSKVVSTLKASRIKQVCFLVKESVELINLLAAALVRRVYSPGNPIIEPKFNAQMFFVIRGRVVLSAFNGSNPKECKTGDFFADTCLLFPEKFEEKAVAITFCELYVLAKVKFDDALAEFYRETEANVRIRMAETLEKYLTQLKKTKKLLGMRGTDESGGVNSAFTVQGDTRTRDTKIYVGWRMPGSVFRAHWDSVRLLAIIFISFEVPYYSVFISMTKEQHMFVEQPEFGLRYSLTFLTEVFFGINLLLRSRFLAHLDPFVMLAIEDPSLIFAAYKADGFYLDLVSWFPIGIILESLSIASEQRYAVFFRLLRLLRLRETPELLWGVCDYYSVSSKAHLVISLLLWVTFMLHVVGCVWFEMAWILDPNASEHTDKELLWELTRPECLEHATHFYNCSWVTFDCYSHIGDVFPAENHGSAYQASFAYMRSVYWAIVTLTGVGYGDIVAYTTAESVFAAFWIFISGIINFGVVGLMSSTISNAMAPHHHHMEKLNTLNSALERMDISEKLSAEIRRFYHHEFKGRKQAYESQLLSNLPDQLCYEISSLLHSEAVKSVALFDSASIEFLKAVTGKFRHRSYQNGDTICLEDDICREFLVFLHGSKVNVFFRSRKVPIQALHQGDCYGVNAFLLKRAHTATLTAASIVHASVMTRDQFDSIQRKFDEDLRDMKEEAQTLWIEQQNMMRLIVQNLEKLKLQPHLMSTSTLFYQGESIPQIGTKKVSRDVYATRDMCINVWNAVITWWNIYNAVFIIFRISFHSHLHFSTRINTLIWAADLLCDIFFLADIYLRLFYLDIPEINIENLLTRTEMDRQYFHSLTFKWNVVTSLPMYTSLPSDSLVASLCRLPRLIRCIDLWTYLDAAIVHIQQHFASRNVSAYLSPAKLMIILVLVAHYVGCIFFWISEKECEHVERCWIAHDHLLHEYHHSIVLLYAKSFYWAITTLLLVGSRESVPRDAAGTLWTGFTCLCCTFIIGHIVGEISELILELGKETKELKTRIASFDGFAKEHELPANLCKRVGFFFREQFEYTKTTDFHHTIQDLSANLRLKLMLEIYGNSISRLPISRFLTSSQINNLALRLQSEMFIPGDSIVVEGTFGSRLCILRRGLGAAFWTNSVTNVAILMEGAVFGEVAFFLPGQRRLATVRATTACEVLYVSKHNWNELWTTSGDLSDLQVQKHAQHAIFDWVLTRLRRYQRGNVRAALKANSLLVGRHSTLNLHEAATAAAGIAKAKTKLSAVLLNHRESSDHDTTSRLRALAGRRGLTTVLEPRRHSVATDSQLLEKKTKFLQAKTEECATKFQPAIASLQDHRRSSTTVSSQRTRTSLSNVSSRFHQSKLGDVPIASSNNYIASDIRVLQFIVDISPVSKHLADSLSDDHLRGIETECWKRFKLLAVALFVVDRLLEELDPLETNFNYAGAKHPQVKIQPARNHLVRVKSYRFDELASRKDHMQQIISSASISTKRRTSGAIAAKKWKAIAVAASPKLSIALSKENGSRARNRRLSVGVPNLPLQKAEPIAHSVVQTERTKRLTRMLRCHSVPDFGREFFDNLRREDDGQLAKNSHEDIDFEILQRCQRPQYSTQLRLFHRYCAWQNRNKATVLPAQNSMMLVALSHRHLIDTIPQTHEASISRTPRSALVTSRLQLSSQQVLGAAKADLKAKEFIKLVKQFGKCWDLIMLFIAMYHLIITPFKVCFSHDLTEISDNMLRGWSGIEICLDILCLFDVGYKIRYISRTYQNGGHSSSNPRRSGILRAVASDPTLRTDIVALFPFELLLFATDIRVPLPFTSHIGHEVSASWWISRWVLRLNRMLLIERIEPFSEQLVQFLIYDRKIHLNEAFLDFLKGLSAYLTMGHLLACIWFITSDIGLSQYGASWLTTSGMLTFIADAEGEEHERKLRDVSTAFSLENIPLFHKYLRSLLFSMECISTLFYGDIVSMNPFELLVEIAITLWSIYIYGALVGTQGELLDSRARREAAFEQTLGELQHYLVQNEVPKGIKRHIKAYYARLWLRRKGEAEFAAVENVCRALYEDVVLTTLRGFAVRVGAFQSLDDQFLRAILVCLQYVVCSESEEVFVIGDMDRSMYFIAEGRILVKMGSGESTRERGEFFGELALLYGISRLETCVAVTVTELYRLDHEPYERLLLEFPEYRSRNKVAWTTFSSGSVRDKSVVEEALRCFRKFGLPKGKANTNVLKGPVMGVNGVHRFTNVEEISSNAARIDAQLPNSYIYRSAMELLSKLSKVDPLEAKDLFLKSRDGARRQLKSALGVMTSRVHGVDNTVYSFRSRSGSLSSKGEEKEDKDRYSESLEQMEAAVAELSRPTEEQRHERMKMLDRKESIRHLS